MKSREGDFVLAKTLIWTFKKEMLILLGIDLFLNALNLTHPLIMMKLIHFVKGDDSSPQD